MAALSTAAIAVIRRTCANPVVGAALVTAINNVGSQTTTLSTVQKRCVNRALGLSAGQRLATLLASANGGQFSVTKQRAAVRVAFPLRFSEILTRINNDVAY